MRPTVTKLKDVRGRITGYRAAIGPIEREAKTPADAVVACEAATLLALRRLDHGPQFSQRWGHVYCVAPTLYGFAYWLDTWGAWGAGQSVQGAYATHEEANAHALRHLAQNVWTHDTDDAAFLAVLPEEVVRAEVAQWIRFQRAYFVRKAEGRSDVECHRLACEDASRGAA